ncbi:hypothetical protein HPP92_001553 [Vanilla planifolia]|uniref:Exportin-1 n=1 Tax=Vanilla planifolia TaxID=51239 RepID=A0A835S7X7_VANPL|nr:hypothetical protein HPP92_001553 [Vanilla planifolia]
MAAEKLRDLTKPIDVLLLDATVAAFYGTGSKEERVAADHILRDLQNNPDLWLQVVHILRNSRNLNTKFFALQVLEGVIKYRWNALPTDQRDGIKNYISDLIVQLSSNEASYRQEKLYVNKLNIILVQVLKHEWPARWQSFIPDLVSAAKTNETICENCMAILKLLSEEVFDFSRGEMTQIKIKELKHSLNSEFQLIHELCLYVLSASQRTELIRATLATLHAFLSWIPLGYIFESPLLETLLKIFPVPAYRNLTLQCLTEIAALHFGEFYDMQYVKMYMIFMVQLQTILPGTNIPDAYANGSSDEQAFILNLALFFTSFFKSHIQILERTDENRVSLLLGLDYLIGISYVDDTEVFKVCLDYWNLLVLKLFESHNTLDNPALVASIFGLPVSGMVDGLGAQVLQRRQLYSAPLSKLRMLMISRMAKPEEVLIVEDENGNIVRETMKDNDVLVQYKVMRETLIYLTHLDHEDTEQKMLKKLSKQLNGEDWSWNNLNTLCWAIGSISGSMVEEQENRFLVMVIRDLLSLCEITKGKDNKAVIASNIMYVVGQYPRFLRAHWKFLKTVVNKLFEFMHETHPGVQDMACDTFLKIVQKCKRKFVITQVASSDSYFLRSSWANDSSESDPPRRDEYLKRLMDLPNQTNTSVASSLGAFFLPQISLIFLDMLTVYRMYSELISNTIAEGGPFASKTSFVKLLRSVKRETLKLIETFVDKAEDQPQIGKQFVPPMMDPVLGDYARNVPDAKGIRSAVTFATIINNLDEAQFVGEIAQFEFVPYLSQVQKASKGRHGLYHLGFSTQHERNIAETGLNLLLELLNNYQASDFRNQFFRAYFVVIEQEIFAVLTDTFHKPGFKLHVLVLQHLFCLVDSGLLTEPLWDPSTVPYTFPNNAAFVRDYTIKLLGASFPNMTAAEVTQFVDGVFESKKDIHAFKNHIRDFLIQSKEFSAQDNKDLYAEEAQAQRDKERLRMLSIPGLVAPSELQDEMVDS